MSDLTDVINDVGGAASDLFSSQGDAAQASDFSQAAQLAQQNAALTSASTRIQETQTARTVAQTIGTQTADIAGAGFTESGSALDLLRSSAQQGALAKALINVQGAVNENSYAAQAGAYSGEAAAANEAATAGTVGAIASLGGALVSGSGTLLSAGKSAVGAVNDLLSGSADTGSTLLTDSSQFTSGPADLSVAANDTNFLGPGVESSDLLSSTDSSIGAGADTANAAALSAAADQTAADSAATASADSGIGSDIADFFSSLF